ncbi:hypothetical protein M0812_13523 [Anaeramoeba flamelloides]|uniref:Tyrosine-protein kinase ephrin type A/B receptor-like domain-containing protein n=1 Tax=Anaeramoeba flamelloides TaxID=1746091 RepID=A0AAV7ZME5_9EUKA|nr:hypothetical protein M0812_13523 [Anaeramoeba flamelloides]
MSKPQTLIKILFLLLSNNQQVKLNFILFCKLQSLDFDITGKKKIMLTKNNQLIVFLFLIVVLTKINTQSQIKETKNKISSLIPEKQKEKKKELVITIKTKDLEFHFEKEFYSIDFLQQAKTKEQTKTQEQKQKEQNIKEQEHQKNQQTWQRNGISDSSFKIWISQKKNINSGKCKKELIIYEKNIEKFRKNRNDLKANLKIVEYKNVLCGVDQYFEINKETNNLKSNFNFTNFRQIKNLVINYEYPRGLEPRIKQTTHSLIFTSKSNKDLTYLQESQPLIINSQHRTCKGQYNVLQNGNNHVSIEYQIPESFLSDPKTKNKSTKTNTNRKTNTNKNNNQSDVKWVLIDPEYSTYIGGVDYEKGTGTRYDQNGNIYLLGLTQSSDFPIVGSNVYNPNYSSESDYDAVIIKAKDGTDLFWSTFICKVGWYFNYYNGLSVDLSDNQAIISGTTEFPKHYPTTSNAWQNNSKNCAQNCPYGYSGFVSKINENGTDLVFSTLVCGYADGCVYVSSHEIIYDHEEETNYGDNYSIYFVGVTNGTQFPGYGLTNDGFKCTSKNFGYDYIFGKISNDGSQLLQTQCLGGTNSELPWEHCLKVDKDYLVFQLYTYSMDFPVTNGAFQQERSTNSYTCVVGQLNITTFELNWASYLGGNKSDYASTIRMDSNQDIWVGGSTRSLDFPVTLDAYRTEGIATNDTNDSFLTKISKDGERLLYSTFLGTSPTDSTNYPNVAELRIDKNNDQILLIGGAGLVSDHINIPSDLNYGNGSFLLYFNYTNNEFLKAYSYGGIINSLDTFNNRIENFAITGEIRYYALRTTDDAFQKEKPGYYDVIFSGNMYGCPKGYYSEDEKFGKCYSCPQGTFNAESDQISKDNCTECERGFYNDKHGATQCKKCAKGTYSSQMGQPQCEECAMGTYQPNEESLDCISCPIGTYNTNQGSTSNSSCIKCRVGTYGLTEAAESYQDSCRDCPLGTYNDEEGKSICKDCPISFYNEYTGSTSRGSCQKCPKGTFSQEEGLASLNECSKCPTNTYSNDYSSTACKYCPIGYETNPNQDDCIKCQKGYYKNKTDINCTPCEENYFNNNEGMTYCLKCGIDGICLGGNQCNIGRDPDSFCSQCIIGYYLKNGELIRFVNTNIFLISEKVDNINFEKLNIKIFYFITLCCRYLYIPETIITSIPFQKTWQTALKKYTLNYYPNISTDDEKYQNFYPWFVFFLIIYMVFIPITFIIILILSKKNNFNDYWGKRFGWLWEFYKTQRFYWEIIKIIFKFFIIITPILISTSSHLTLVLVLLLCLLVIMIILILIFKPYPRIIPFDKEKRKYKSYWEKMSPEDLLTIGLYLKCGTDKKNSKLNGDDEINESRMKKFSFVVSENPNLHANAKKLSDKNEKINDENQNSLSTTSSQRTDSSSNSSSNFDSNDSQNENDIGKKWKK